MMLPITATVQSTTDTQTSPVYASVYAEITTTVQSSPVYAEGIRPGETES